MGSILTPVVLGMVGMLALAPLLSHWRFMSAGCVLVRAVFAGFQAGRCPLPLPAAASRESAVQTGAAAAAVVLWAIDSWAGWSSGAAGAGSITGEACRCLQGGFFFRLRYRVLGLDSCDKARCIQGCWDELAASLVKLADVCKVGFDLVYDVGFGVLTVWTVVI